MAKIVIQGLDELQRKLKKLPFALERAIGRAVAGEVNEVAQDLRRHAPVDDGDLVRSIQEEFSDNGTAGTVAITARHAPFVIHGTSDTPANDFVTPAISRSEKRFPDRVHNEVLKELKNL